MNDFIDGFKMDLMKLMDGWYEDLELLVYDTMYSMCFVEDDPDGNYQKLEEVMIEVLQERLIGVFEEEALN